MLLTGTKLVLGEIEGLHPVLTELQVDTITHED